MEHPKIFTIDAFWRVHEWMNRRVQELRRGDSHEVPYSKAQEEARANTRALAMKMTGGKLEHEFRELEMQVMMGASMWIIDGEEFAHLV